MEPVVFTRDSNASSSTNGRAMCVFQAIGSALSTHGMVERRETASLVGRRALPLGLEQVRLPQTLIAFDRDAHINLADFQKRSVFIQDLGLGRSDVDIDRLIWSSVNTSRAMALGASAWASMQLLPIQAMAHRHLPPINMGPPGDDHCSVRLLAHGHQPLAAAAITVLRRAGFSLMETHDVWRDSAAIHLHIGGHDLDAEEPRLVDSWASGRLVLQMPGTATEADRSQQLCVDDERNGILCSSIDELVFACKDLCRDASFRRQLVRAGQKTTATHLRDWSDIAGFLLS